MKKIILFLIAIVCLAWISTFAYDLTKDDNDLLDRVESKLITIIDDESNNITAEVLVSYIEGVLVSREFTDRQQTLLEVIADDISWEYEIWEYEDYVQEELTAEDCYDDEYYDEEDRMCYYLEDEEYDDEIEYDAGDTAHDDDEHVEAEVIASYSISGDRITLESGTDDVKNQEVWNIFTALIPSWVRKDIVRYEVSDDARGDTAAHVAQIEGDNTQWLMNVNLDAFYVDGILEPEESYATLIHEFAHVLTLDKTQVRYTPENASDEIYDRFESKCDTNFLQEWCLLEWAYLNDFINTFWSDKDYLEKVRNEEVSAYEDAPESFITDYAATNPGEDIAESFTYFVLRSKPDWNTIADKKLRFFYDYKQLDSLRKQIRSNLAKLK